MLRLGAGGVVLARPSAREVAGGVLQDGTDLARPPEGEVERGVQRDGANLARPCCARVGEVKVLGSLLVVRNCWLRFAP